MWTSLHPWVFTTGFYAVDCAKESAAATSRWLPDRNLFLLGLDIHSTRPDVLLTEVIHIHICILGPKASASTTNRLQGNVSQVPEATRTPGEAMLHMWRKQQDLISSQVHHHVGCLPKDQREDKYRPNSVKPQAGELQSTNQKLSPCEGFLRVQHLCQCQGAQEEYGAQARKQYPEEGEKEPLVAQADAVVNPRAMVIKPLNAATALLAVEAPKAPV
eukprot:CAMPEP_0206492248 /NCGR_PEP_ID=MMETSP0324_2-20121206/45884_1 /ASSEMBLY_ACC=CAM_ASM_000836 /TAXON_ID=2866 /ORGANISM="Crypthecodinium cohnii, Strain Seligo" /LENGTH=216 /DNA_ID=CAMNT_0053974405 /DNA_START=147 /DNA_END=797 /DNA_ORIENTATION=+